MSSEELGTSDEESHADESAKIPKVQTSSTIDPKQARSEQQKFLDNLKAKVERSGQGDEAKKAKDKEPSDEEKKHGESDSDSKVDLELSPSKLEMRKKRKRRAITICTANCRYEVVRRVAYRFGMREVAEDESWNLYWTDLSITVERCKEMKRFQKINHFPGMSEICRKDLLARNLNRMLKIFPKDYCFFPKTWCLPADMGDLQAYARIKRNKTYILKPDMGCQGRGIYLTKSVKDLKPQEKMICQVYIAKPFLIDGYKFDFRVYTLITSCDPLRIFVYNDGLVRFATSRYREPTGHNTTNVYMHLTNYAVNKHSRTYVVDDELGSKRKISTLNKWFESKDYDLEDIWASTDDVIIKTIIAAHPMLKHSYHTCFPTHDYTYACFELLGFDILLDQHLKPYVLEVNHSPSFHCDSQIDKDIKEGLLRDTFEILNLQQCDKKKIMEEDRRRIRERLLQGIYKEQNMTETETTPSRSPLQIQTAWEEKHKGNFRKIYPNHGSEKYDKFFNQNLSSLFQDTAASRAREEASRVQREESLVKAKQEALRRNGGKLILERLRPESPSTKLKMQKKASLKKIKDSMTMKKVHSSSFDPVPIVEAEEMERLNQLKQREFLVRSYGLIEQIYLCLKKNRTLRPEDEAKYGLYGKLSMINNTVQNDPPKKFKQALCNVNINNNVISNVNMGRTNDSTEKLANTNALNNLKQNELGNQILKWGSSINLANHIKNKLNNKNTEKIGDKSPNIGDQGSGGDKSHENEESHRKKETDQVVGCPNITGSIQDNRGLCVRCNEAPISIRPIPSHTWPYSGSNNPPQWASHIGPIANSNVGYEPDIRYTKAQVARTYTNNVKLRQLEKREKYHFGNLDM
ncbi:UNVERIFIED_CONTAM: hypothetical protein PYX00_008018 [Menopon gallinae]|uniref:Tubulin polyglutamylase TTLL13 n=1 Tax=Menopon gallinae TaxID=328185 RepID=A0AAW2HMS4_9NEOP